VSLVVVGLCLAMCVAFCISIRRGVRKTGYNEWAERWKAVDADRRRRIGTAISRGEAVDDPRDAPLAVELIDRRRAFQENALSGPWWKFFDRVTDVWMTLFVVSVALVTHNPLLVAFVCLPELFFVAMRLKTRRAESRIACSRAKNQELMRRFL
jgi:hypothetical protein